MRFDWIFLTLIFTTGIALWVAYKAWQRTTSGSKVMTFLMLAIAEWSLAGAFEAAAVQKSGKIFWSQVSYLGIHSLPPLYLMLAWYYNQREEWLSKRFILPLWIVPVITVGLAATNNQHHLIWSGFHWLENHPHILIYEHGPAFWVGAIYDYILILAATILFIYAAQHSAPLYKKQTRLIILAALIPWIGNILYVTKTNPISHRDLSPVYFLISGVLLTWSLSRFKFLDLTPIARSKVINTMTDGVIIIDNQNRVGDLNKAAREWVGKTKESVIGEPAHAALNRWPDLAAHFSTREQDVPIEQVIQDNEGHWYNAKITPLQGGKQKKRGTLITVQDINVQRELENALREREKLYRSVTENANDGIVIVQDSLIKFSNPQLSSMLGYPQEEIINSSFLKFIAPEQQPIIQKRHEQRMQGEEVPSRYETKLLHASGRIIPVEFNISPITYQNNPAIMGIVRDITEQKTAQRKLQRYAHQQKVLNDITREAMQATDIEEALQSLADNLGKLIQADGCFITLWDRDMERVQPAAAYGPYRDQYKDIQVNANEPTITEAVLEKEAPLVIEDAHSTPHLNQDRAEQFSTRSVLAVPLMVHDQKMGAALLTFDEPHTFSKDEIHLGQQASRQIALALLKVQLTKTAQERAMEMTTLREAGFAVASTLDLDTAIDQILEQLHRVVSYDSASVQLLRNGALEIVGGRGWDDPHEVVGMRFPIPGNNPNTEVVQSGQPRILQDTRASYQPFKEGPHSHIRSWLGVPLISRDEIIGMLALDSSEEGYFDPSHGRLVSAFANQVAVAIENARLFEEVQHLATTDELTGIHNRRYLFEMGQREVERALRYEHPLSTIMLDIDHFKQINDTYGHAVGDEVLQGITDRISHNMREIDLLGRYGGEEFSILLPETELDEATILAERLRMLIREKPISTSEKDFDITISLGVAQLSGDCQTFEALMDRSDSALYFAKQNGRNRVETWSPSLK